MLDIRLPGLSGLDAQTKLAEAGNPHPDRVRHRPWRHPDVGARHEGRGVDFLPKPFRDQEMLDAVSAALGRDRARRAQARGVEELQARYGALSARERQVMALVTSGLLNKQVAGELGLSEITVKIHRGNAMRKMAARSLADLVRGADRV